MESKLFVYVYGTFVPQIVNIIDFSGAHSALNHSYTLTKPCLYLERLWRFSCFCSCALCLFTPIGLISNTLPGQYPIGYRIVRTIASVYRKSTFSYISYANEGYGFALSPFTRAYTTATETTKRSFPKEDSICLYWILSIWFAVYEFVQQTRILAISPSAKRTWGYIYI